MKPIKNFDGYFIDKEGNVFSNKSGNLKNCHHFLIHGKNT